MVILEQPHANRWIVRERRTSIAIGRITELEHDAPHPCYRAETLNPLDPAEHVLLRDSDTLDNALAQVAAHSHLALPRPPVRPADEDVA